MKNFLTVLFWFATGMLHAQTATVSPHQPRNSNLDSISNLATATYGCSVLETADAAALRTLAGLGTLATLSTVTSTQITDGTITNADISGAAAIELSKLAVDPLARANHTGTQLWSTIDTSNLTTLQLGVNVDNDAVDQIIKAADGITGQDRNGGDLTLSGGASTGAGMSSVIFTTSAAGDSGTDVRAVMERMRITTFGITIQNTAVPTSNPPEGGFTLYVDPGDGSLRALGPNGNISILARP